MRNSRAYHGDELREEEVSWLPLLISMSEVASLCGLASPLNYSASV